jgi:hypothetical protein
MNDSNLTKNVTNCVELTTIFNDDHPVINILDFPSIEPSSEIPSLPSYDNLNNYLDQDYIDIIHISHEIIKYPTLLDKYIQKGNMTSKIAAELLASCIEYEKQTIMVDMSPDEYQARLSSIDHIVNIMDNLTIKLLPNKYRINHELYDYVISRGINDPHYNSCLNCQMISYCGENILHKNKIFTYRDAYHRLLYGNSKDLLVITVRWDLWGPDIGLIAACDFFNLPPTTSIDVIMKYINNESKFRDKDYPI